MSGELVSPFAIQINNAMRQGGMIIIHSRRCREYVTIREVQISIKVRIVGHLKQMGQEGGFEAKKSRLACLAKSIIGRGCPQPRAGVPLDWQRNRRETGPGLQSRTEIASYVLELDG
jgi:hypothetical protein